MDSLSSLCETKVNVRNSVWSPIMKCDIQCPQRVQRRFTNRLGDLYDTLYYGHLISLNIITLTLEHERIVSNVSLLHKCVYDKVDYCLEDIGIKLAAYNKRSDKSRLTQHHQANCVSNAFFASSSLRVGTLCLREHPKAHHLDNLKSC